MIRQVELNEAVSLVMSGNDDIRELQGDAQLDEEARQRLESFERQQLTTMYADAHEVLAVESEGKFRGLVGVLFSQDNCVKPIRTMVYNYPIDGVMDEFITYAQTHYAGKRLCITASMDEDSMYELLRLRDFTVEAVERSVDDDEEPFEYIECSKML